LSQFAHATLVDRPARLGDALFQLYIVQPNSARDPAPPVRSFQNNLQLLDEQAYQLAVNNSPWLVTRWSMLRSEQRQIRMTYNYALTALLAGSSDQKNSSVCSFATMHAGDELFVAFHLPAEGTLPGSASLPSMAIMARLFITVPYDPWYGPFHLETNNNVNTPLMSLQTTDGQASMTLQVSKSQNMTSFASGRFVTY